jgi:large subunit ribosomal protein L16
MLVPKRTKYRKQMRGHMKGNATSGNALAYGEFGLGSEALAWVSARQIEAARRAITHHTQRGGRLWIRIFPDKPITKKPAEVRMGSGKGDVHEYVAIVKPGRIMSAGYIHIRSLFINLQGVADTQCGFKIFDKEAALRIIDRLRVFRRKRKAKGSVVSAGFDVEFLFVGTKLGYKIKEVPVIWKHVDTENVLYFVQDGIRTLKDIILMKYYDLAGKYNS